ncbi:MAG TPA: thioredoxin family protein [Verrucomicrobiae bacterium]
MRAKKIIPLIVFCALAVNARADEIIPVLQVGSETYSNVTVTSVSQTDIFFTYAGGMANVKIKKLSPELQRHFNFNPDLAQAIELKQAANKAKYHAQLLQQPDAHPPDMTREPVARTAETAAGWGNDFPTTLKQAQAENKLVLLNFTGSDWCEWCMKFDHEVLSTDHFASYAAKNLVMLKADFPHNTPQDETLRRNNAALQKTFKVDGFPTYILLNANGDELGRQVGYLGGGPDAFIKELEMFAHH